MQLAGSTGHVKSFAFIALLGPPVVPFLIPFLVGRAPLLKQTKLRNMLVPTSSKLSNLGDLVLQLPIAPKNHSPSPEVDEGWDIPNEQISLPEVLEVLDGTCFVFGKHKNFHLFSRVQGTPRA